jgi:urease
VCADSVDLELALYGSFLPVPKEDKFPIREQPGKNELAGAIICGKDKIRLNPGRKRYHVEVKNLGDRPIQVGSHYNFLEVNAALLFDRELAYGKHLDIAAGTAVRFEPGERKTVQLVEIGGHKNISGGHGLCPGPLDESKRHTVVPQRVRELDFAHKKQETVEEAPVPEMDREVVSWM